MFTYAPPFWRAVSADASALAVPLAGLVHGPQSATATGPGWPVRPVWMWAAAAGPVSPLNVIVHLTVAPVPDFVTVAVNVPRAPATSPDGAGTS